MTVSQNWRFRPLAPASVEMKTFDRCLNSWTSASRTATSRLGRCAGGNRVSLVRLPLLQRTLRIRSVVVAAKQGDVAGLVAVFQQQACAASPASSTTR